VQVSYRAPEGAVRFADAGVERLATDDGGQYVVVLRDVTERVHRTRELERQNDRLEEFAQVLAHELRNPLNIAGGRLELARAGGPDVEEHLQRVREAHERIERMIEELLGLSRQGNVVGETATENLESVVRSAWEETPTADATLVVECDGQSLTADRERVRDVLRNLFRNAVEHGRSDATIRVGALTSDAGFYVEDDGPGIPEAERESVLEPGYTTTESGTGFGLAIVDQIAAAHDWDVAVTSGSEGGARFEITGTAAASRDT
jgi:signal transduction histidine kinase